MSGKRKQFKYQRPKRTQNSWSDKNKKQFAIIKEVSEKDLSIKFFIVFFNFNKC